MTTRRTMVAAAAVLALGLSACGSDDPETGSASGTAGGEGLKVGIKFDQPGLGLKQGSEFTGMDVDVATYIAKELGVDAANIEFVQAPSAQRETLLETSQVDMVVATYSITDARKEKISFAGPYFIAGQDLLVRSDDTSITGQGHPGRQEALLGHRLHVGPEDQGRGARASTSRSSRPTPSASQPSPPGAIDALTTDDTILAGYAAQPQYKDKLKVVGQPFSEERYGVGLKKGDTATCQKVTDAINKMIADGEWQKIVDKNLGPAGYKPGTGNPPTPDACA